MRRVLPGAWCVALVVTMAACSESLTGPGDTTSRGRVAYSYHEDADCHSIDFNTRPDGQPSQHGDIITTIAMPAFGLSVVVEGNSGRIPDPFRARLYDTNTVGGPDPDLEWNGGTCADCEGLDRVLVIGSVNDNRFFNVEGDEPDGGAIIMTGFAGEGTFFVHSFKAIDQEATESAIFLLVDGISVASSSGQGDGSVEVVTLPQKKAFTHSMEFILSGSGAIDDIVVCREREVPIEPGISLVKLTNGTDNNSPTGPVVEVGSTVTWTYIVTNTGNVTLKDVVVTDDNGTPADLSDDFVVGTLPLLAPGAHAQLTATGIAQAGQYGNVGTATGTPVDEAGDPILGVDPPSASDPDHYFGEARPGAVLLIIDEDGLDNDLHFNASGGGITPSGPQKFTKSDVNDDKPGHRQRDVLRYFANNVGRTITVRTGQTGDEGWFAPNCAPQKWISGSSNTCLTGEQRQVALANYFGLNGSSAIPAQSRLDKIPAVMPLRALGLVSLVGKDVCAVVYDSDLSINYNGSSVPFTDGNLQGETLGIVAFRVNQVRTLNGFSSSTLPEVQITILDTSVCGNFQLFNAPVPRSSSVPNDRLAENPVTSTGSNGYRRLQYQDGPLLY